MAIIVPEAEISSMDDNIKYYAVIAIYVTDNKITCSRLRQCGHMCNVHSQYNNRRMHFNRRKQYAVHHTYTIQAIP